MILDSLRYWVETMHVDGFRFDLASILNRDESGNVMPNPPVLWDIESDPALARTKLIAEAWDAAGLYQVGSFASQLVLPQGHLFGDWAGTRAWLEERPASYSDIYLTVSSCDGGRRHHA
jgi:isoamylase